MARPNPNDLRIRALRLGFQALRLVSHDLACRGAERLFSTPRRRRETEVERALLRTGRTFHFRSKGLRLRGHVWGEGPAVLCLHGWEGQGSQFHAFVEPLAQAGFSLLTFDQPGHGGSQGRRSGPLDWAQASLDLVAQVGPVHGVVAHSLGAAGIAVAMDHGLQVPRAVFLAPPARPDPFYFGVLALLGFPKSEHPAALEAYARRAGLPPERIRLHSLTPRLTPPTLVIHDRTDREVPWSDGKAIAEAVPQGHLLSTEGLGHRRILRDPGVIEASLAFLKQGEATNPVPFHGEGSRSLEWHLFHRDFRTDGIAPQPMRA